MNLKTSEAGKVYRMSDGQEQDLLEPAMGVVRGPSKGRAMAASDMDHTMVGNDLGVLVFLEKIQDKEFWNMSTQEFKALLLPKDYLRKIQEWADSGYPDLKSGHCKLILDLYTDIIRLFHLQQAHKDKPDSRMFTMIMKEFGRKMLEMDRIIIEVDPLLKREMNGMLLMRTRFFAGREPGKIRELTERVIERSKDPKDRRYVSFPMYDQLRREGKQQVTPEYVREIMGKDSPFELYDQGLPMVEPVRQVLHCLSSHKVPTVVATANLQGIGKTLVRETDFNFLNDQGIGEVVLGTRLRQQGAMLRPEIDGMPLSGKEKARAVLSRAAAIGREPKVFLGDSPSGDLDAMIATLQRRGLVYIVGQNPDVISKKFRRKFADVFGAHGKELEQVFCIETGGEGFAH